MTLLTASVVAQAPLVLLETFFKHYIDQRKETNVARKEEVSYDMGKSSMKLTVAVFKKLKGSLWIPLVTAFVMAKAFMEVSTKYVTTR